MVPIFWRSHLKSNVCATLLFSQQFVETYNLVQEKHGVQISISFPNQTGRNLTKSFTPLFNSQFFLFVEAAFLVSLLDLEHVEDELLV